MENKKHAKNPLDLHYKAYIYGRTSHWKLGQSSQ